jgi:hypothetical protein
MMSSGRTILFFCTAAAILIVAACRQNEDPTYTFESAPRAVLENLGIAASRDPKVQISSSGNLALLAVYKEQERTGLGVFLSHDGGDGFGHRLPVSPAGQQIVSHGENSPSLIYTPTAIYALWEQASPSGFTDLMFARSVDFGRSFQEPVPVCQKEEPSFNGFSTMGLAPNGDLYAVWLDGREKDSPPGTFSVYISRSTDKGTTFGTNMLVAKGACPCCRPAITFGSNGQVFVAWRHVFESNVRDMVVASSTDGATFRSPVRVAQDNWKLDGCPDSGPALEFHNGSFFIAWYTEASKDSVGIKLSRSSDGAKSFGEPLLVSGKILDANHPDLSLSSDGRLLLTFQGRDPSKNGGWSPTAPYLVEIEEGSITDPIRIPSGDRSVSYPVVLSGPSGRTFITWTEPCEMGQRVMLIRARKKL